jgi:hypothetical protein
MTIANRIRKLHVCTESVFINNNISGKNNNYCGKSCSSCSNINNSSNNNNSKRQQQQKQVEVVTIKQKEEIKSESCLEMAAVQRFFDFKSKIKNTVVELNVTYCREARPHIGLQ